jgi:hypothetical protein
MAMIEAELRASLLAVGPLNPALVWRGVTLDGRRRESICFDEGIALPRKELHSLEQACAALWIVHPERAIQVAREHRGGHVGVPATVREIAELCGTTATAVALELAKERPAQRQSNRSPRRTRSIKTEALKVWCEPQLKHYVRLVAAKRGMDISQFIRVACWEYIQKHLGRAPTEGTSRAPSIEHVRAPKPPRG